MTQNIALKHEDILHAGFTGAIQELLSGATPQFYLVFANSTTLKIVPGAGDKQQSISIQGRYRFRTTETTAALPGATPDGTHPVFVTASDNDYSGPTNEPDKPTVYTFGLEIKKSGETPGTALYRQVGSVIVVSGAITGFEQTAGGVSGAMLMAGALSAAGDLTWTRDTSGNWVPALKATAPNAAKRFAQTIGNGALKEFTIEHNLNTRNVDVVVRDAAAPYLERIGGRIAEALTVNTVKLIFVTAPTTNQFVVTVQA